MRPAPSHSARAAFTLIELVTVMVLLGILAAAVGVPTLAYIDQMRSSAAAARLAADIRYMQRMALGTGLRTWITVDSASNRYSLFVEDANNPGKAGRVPVVHPLDQNTNAVQFGTVPFTNVTISSVSFNSTSELEFDNFGMPYDANGTALSAAGQVVLSNNIAVQVHPVGGYVESLPWP